MEIPSRVKLGNHVFSVNLVDYLIEEHVGESVGVVESWAGGELVVDKLEITISTTSPRSVIEEVFIHEIVEGINSLHDLRLSHTKISVFAVALYDFIKNNPKIFKEAEQLLPKIKE